MIKPSSLILLLSLLIYSSCEDQAPMTAEQIVVATAQEKPGIDIMIGALTDTLSKTELNIASENSVAGEILKAHDFKLTDSTSDSTSYVPLQLTRIYEKEGCACEVIEYYSIIPSSSEIRKTVQINCHNK